MENVKTPSETEQHTMKVVRARRILNEMNVPQDPRPSGGGAR